VPGAEIELRGETFASGDALGRTRGKSVETGAFAAFGTSQRRVAGSVRCSGSVLRVPVAGGEPELVAWGFRNPFGLAFAPDGSLYATDNGYDERGSRPVWGSADHLWRVEQGSWYGWPDYSGDRPLTDDEFRPPRGPELEFVLARHPGKPPEPVAAFDVHCSANGLDVSTSEAFGHAGDAFVALFGDQAPAVGKVLAPVGFKVVRVELDTGQVEEFAVNRGKKNGPASRIGGGGLERPVAVRFDPRGEALYVVDFGVLLQDAKGSHPQPGTGVIWRISRGGAR
jgi:glucose/arabinose dehydrogenase